MPAIYKILGQASPALNTWTTLYEVPASASSVSSSMDVTHLGGEGSPSAIYRVRIVKAGDAEGLAKQLNAYDLQLAANTVSDGQRLMRGKTLAAGDRVQVWCDGAACSFGLYGAEIAPFATPTVTALYETHDANPLAHGGYQRNLRAWAEHVEMIDIVYDVTEVLVIASATVIWPDGSNGVFTTIAINSTWKSIDAYTITHTVSGLTVRQAEVTRNANGLITHKPALTVA